MLLFTAGMATGAGLTIMVLGFLAVVAEDQEREDRAWRKREAERRNREKLEKWYRNAE